MKRSLSRSRRTGHVPHWAHPERKPREHIFDPLDLSISESMQRQIDESVGAKPVLIRPSGLTWDRGLPIRWPNRPFRGFPGLW